MAWYHRFWAAWFPTTTTVTPQATPQQAPNYLDSLGGYGPPSFNTNEFPGQRPQQQTNYAPIIVGKHGRRWFLTGAPGPMPATWSPDYVLPHGWREWLRGIAPTGWKPGMPGAAVFDQYGNFLRWDATDTSPWGMKVEPVNVPTTPAPQPAPWQPTPFSDEDWQRLKEWRNISLSS